MIIRKLGAVVYELNYEDEPGSAVRVCSDLKAFLRGLTGLWECLTKRQC
jgi:hypothetical protein